MTSRVTYTIHRDRAGTQALPEGAVGVSGPLSAQLGELLTDTGTPATELICEVSERAQQWVFSQQIDWGFEEAEVALEEGLRPLEEAHGWRGVFATWIDQLRGALAWAAARPEQRSPRTPLAEEMGLWLEADGSLRNSREPLTPLCDSPRVIPPRAVAPHALRELQPGETILVFGCSPELVECVRAAFRAGLAPELLIAEGRPSLSGREMARAASTAGVRARLVLDAGLSEAARAADRVWVATESIGSERTITQLGVSGVIELCLEQEIPLELLATTDACHPTGAGAAAPAGDPTRVWIDRPAGVEVDAHFFESVPTRAFTRWFCEHGARTPASHEWPGLSPRPTPRAAGRRDHSEVTEQKGSEADRA